MRIATTAPAPSPIALRLCTISDHIARTVETGFVRQGQGLPAPACGRYGTCVKDRIAVARTVETVFVRQGQGLPATTCGRYDTCVKKLRARLLIIVAFAVPA